MDTNDLNITDTVPAHSVEPGDQIIVDGDPIEVKSVDDTSTDPDEVIVRGYSHESGDAVEYTLYAFDEFDLWSI